MSRITAVIIVWIYCLIAWDSYISYRVDCTLGVQKACEYVQGLYK